MTVYHRHSIPESVGRGTLDPELEAWLPHGPTLGADVSIAQGRRDHAVLGEGPWPEIGAVDYQPAPEAKYPTQIDEIEFFVRWLFEHAEDERVDPARIALGGDSAGGNMTCVIALKLRDEHGPRLALQVPLFPEAAFPGSENRTGLQNSDDGRHPYVTPLNAASHADLPPTILVTNGYDPLRDVGHEYARRLAAAGNDISYVHCPDLTHGLPQFTRYSRACHAATEQLADLIKAKLNGG